MKEKVVSNNEKSFVLRTLIDCLHDEDSALRTDGRKLLGFRKKKVSFGQEYGHAEAHLGKTKCLCQVSCKAVYPSEDRPTEGIIRYNVRLSPMADPLFILRSGQDKAIDLSRKLEHIFKESRCIDTDSLCIKAGEQVWEVRVDVTVLDDDGSVLDCAALAALSGLLNFKRPFVSISGEEVTIHPLCLRPPVALAIHHRPICITFGFVENGTIVFVDPSKAEMQICQGTITVAMNPHMEICAILQQGSMPLSQELLLNCTKLAQHQVSDISDMIDQALTKEMKQDIGSSIKSMQQEIASV